jgi:hypothetical protein
MVATRNRVWLGALALGFLATTPTDAWAYIDPGTGSYLFQLAAAGFFAGMFTLRQYWDVVKARFAKPAPIRERNDRSPDSIE